MERIDVEYCGGLLMRVGDHLLEMSRGAGASEDREYMFGRFAKANGWAKEQIESWLANKYPQIKWSDSEFDLDKQRKAEFAEYWICDPLDGAVHYLQGFGFWSISLCLIRDGRPVFAMVYDPCQKELFHAEAGQGAFLNGVRVMVAEKKELRDAFLATSHPARTSEDLETTADTSMAIGRVMPEVFALRMLGAVSLQLAYVASGRLDGYWELGEDMHDWLAGAFLVQEAGGCVTDGRGGAFTWGSSGIVAANRSLLEKLQKLVY